MVCLTMASSTFAVSVEAAPYTAMPESTVQQAGFTNELSIEPTNVSVEAAP